MNLLCLCDLGYGIELLWSKRMHTLTISCPLFWLAHFSCLSVSQHWINMDREGLAKLMTFISQTFVSATQTKSSLASVIICISSCTLFHSSLNCLTQFLTMVITHVIAIINFTDLNMNFKPDFLALKKKWITDWILQFVGPLINLNLLNAQRQL